MCRDVQKGRLSERDVLGGEAVRFELLGQEELARDVHLLVVCVACRALNDHSELRKTKRSQT